MVTYCVTAGPKCLDLDGIDRSVSGGRWNHQGTPVIYTSTSRSLALVEFLLERPSLEQAVDGVYMVTVEIPDTAVMTLVSVLDLPEHWQNVPENEQLADIGTNWAESGRSLLLRVPSTVIPQEFNVLVNPAHRMMSDVVVREIEEIPHAGRLLALE